jgi:predicted phage-related endonuclease
VQPLVDELVIIKKQLDMLTEREKELKSALLTCMESNGEQKWVGDNIQISYKGSYSRESVDTKALKENEPALYEQYKKVSKVSASITYKIL